MKNKSISRSEWAQASKGSIVFNAVELSDVSAVNNDGTSRQELIKQLKRNENIYLQREQRFPRNKYPVSAWSNAGKIGYVPKHIAWHIIDRGDAGWETLSRASEPVKGNDGLYSCKIDILTHPKGSGKFYIFDFKVRHCEIGAPDESWYETINNTTPGEKVYICPSWNNQGDEVYEVSDMFSTYGVLKKRDAEIIRKAETDGLNVSAVICEFGERMSIAVTLHDIIAEKENSRSYNVD